MRTQLQPKEVLFLIVLEEELSGMGSDDNFGAMVDACLKAHAAVVKTGTPAMVAMMRALLWQLGQEAAQREARAGNKAHPYTEIHYVNMGRAAGKGGEET
ncbi:hypothetical protein [Methylobacterium sp. J-090]|uniref:hypothetical protein n=1 Tax=Methylobacterium sp. J-090 TaxID=2836666 RepID=UPI001FB9F6B4|nr:hypothetical protein [Methylobacterium sp. J-090]MCJ2083546.1 hypothetical protein [Methylobacterium sp. J-090]